MKKIKVAPQTAKRIKAIVAAAMALTLAVPTTSYFSSKAASSSVDAEGSVDVPKAIMTVDFETGFMGEASKSGLEVVKSEEVLKFAEKKDASGNYEYDSEGHQIFAMTDTPFIEGNEYKKGVVGNQPSTAYDSEMGNVLSLDSTVKIAEFKKEKSDSLDSTYPVGTVLQKAVTAESQIKLNNPFVGKDLEKSGGASISYWVKAAEKKNDAGEVVGGANSSLINFNNSSLVVMQKDDYMKYQACQNYSADNADYSMGTQKIMTDPATGNTYEVYMNYGKLIRFNPNYPKNSDAATVKGGWYVSTKDSSMLISVIDEEGNSYKISSLYGDCSTVIDEGLYKYFCNRYNGTDDEGYSTISKIREEAIRGSLSITAGNDFVFRTDDYDDEEIVKEDGTKGKVAVQGTKVTNPNSDQSEKEFAQFDVYNQFFFNVGSEQQGIDSPTLALDEDTATVSWHFVTVVIEDGMVYNYVDGELLSPLEYYYYMGGTPNESGMQKFNAGKAFNKGLGCDYEVNGKQLFAYPSDNVADWSADGTANDSPANGASISMLAWLADAGTELYIGGKGYAAGCQSIDLDLDTVDGTMVDDISFYDVPLTAEQAKALYDNAKSNKESVPAKDELEAFTFDDGTMTGTKGTTMENASTNIAGSDPEIVSDATRGNVLAIKKNNTSGTSAVKLSKNPFEGLVNKDSNITGATVNFWVKEPGQGAKNVVAQSVGISFADEKKVMDYDKMATTLKGTEAASSLYVTTACDGFFYEGSTSQVYQSLGNNFLFSTKRNANVDSSKASFEQESLDKYNEYLDRLQSMTSWHMVTLVMKNSGLYIYMDGEELPNNMYDKGTNAPNFFGLRFYDGYYGRIYDGYRADKNNCGSNNQFGLPLLTWLTDSSTSAYIGYANKLGSEATFESTYESYYDNIRYFGTALSADQIKEIYAEEKVAEVEDNNNGQDNNGNASGDNSTGNSQVITGNVDGDKVTFSYGGVTVEATVDVIPADTKLVLGTLGTSSDADVYASFEDIVAKNGTFTSKQMIVYTAKAEDATFTPNGTFKITFDIPDGFATDNLVVVGDDGTVYEGVLSEDGKKITIETRVLGNYALVEKEVSSEDGSEVLAATTTAGKTGDDSNVALPIAISVVALATVAVVYKKRKTAHN